MTSKHTNDTHINSSFVFLLQTQFFFVQSFQTFHQNNYSHYFIFLWIPLTSFFPSVCFYISIFPSFLCFFSDFYLSFYFHASVSHTFTSPVPSFYWFWFLTFFLLFLISSGLWARFFFFPETYNNKRNRKKNTLAVSFFFLSFSLSFPHSRPSSWTILQKQFHTSQ